MNPRDRAWRITAASGAPFEMPISVNVASPKRFGIDDCKISQSSSQTNPEKNVAMNEAYSRSAALNSARLLPVVVIVRVSVCYDVPIVWEVVLHRGIDNIEHDECR